MFFYFFYSHKNFINTQNKLSHFILLDAAWRRFRFSHVSSWRERTPWEHERRQRYDVEMAAKRWTNRIATSDRPPRPPSIISSPSCFTTCIPDSPYPSYQAFFATYCISLSSSFALRPFPLIPTFSPSFVSLLTFLSTLRSANKIKIWDSLLILRLNIFVWVRKIDES